MESFGYATPHAVQDLMDINDISQNSIPRNSTIRLKRCFLLHSGWSRLSNIAKTLSQKQNQFAFECQLLESQVKTQYC